VSSVAGCILRNGVVGKMAEELRQSPAELSEGAYHGQNDGP
jgi:hypothetical protein